MKLSAIGSYLSQTEAAILAVIAEKIMASAERYIATRTEDCGDACDAQDAAYTLKCIAEQSILANDGRLAFHISAMKADPWIQANVDMDVFDNALWEKKG